MSLMMKEILEQPEALERCMKTNANVIKSVAALIKEKRIHTVYIAARGTSDHAGVYGKYLFEYLTGLPVALAASSIITLYDGSIQFNQCLVIGISQSGEAADVLSVVNQANKNGGLTVTITNKPESPLAKAGNFHLDCAAGDEKSVAATKTFTTQMLLMAMLAGEMSNHAIDLSVIPGLVKKALDSNISIANQVSRFRFMSECFVLGRGINYAATLEMALKIQETTYVRAKAFAVSDFQHGPIAMVSSEIPVILLASKGPALKDMIEMYDRLKNEGIELIVISDQKELCEKAQCGLLIPECESEVVSVFMQVAVAQLFACNLAEIRGLNPDVPRRLNKVTVTL